MAVEYKKQITARFKNGVFPVDFLVLIFSALMTVVSLLFFNTLSRPFLFTVADITIFLVLFYLIVHEKRITDSASYWLHSWLPVISVAVFYTQATAYDHLIFKETFEPLLLQWESNLFGNFNRLADFPGNNLLVDELMHFFYFSYYLILFIPGMIMLSRRSPRAHEMIFSLTLMMVAHCIFFILFPGNGPVENHPIIFTRGLIFIPLMNIIYEIGGNQGGGAIPSTHVAVAVMVFLYSFFEFKRVHWPVLITAAGIVFATVYCSYHYIIDTLAGLFTGIMFYFIGKRVYLNWDHPAELAAESLSRQ
ncbi:MAG: phosphatase PAP2 family protein [Candidatus Marinimicrobia bacterium]|nr:phosphatase PAP2 family protein [Candidatus Neomarinimicrobiota bacterium]